MAPDFDGLHRGHCGWVEDDERMRFNGLPNQLQEKVGIGQIFKRTELSGWSVSRRPHVERTILILLCHTCTVRAGSCMEEEAARHVGGAKLRLRPSRA